MIKQRNRNNQMPIVNNRITFEMTRHTPMNRILEYEKPRNKFKSLMIIGKIARKIDLITFTMVIDYNRLYSLKNFGLYRVKNCSLIRVLNK